MTASLMLRKLGSYPRQNGFGRRLARAGTHRAHAVHSGLATKRGTASPRACRVEQGRSPQRAGPCRVLQPPGRNPRPQLRAAALPGQRPNLVTAATVLWNTVYLERAANALRGYGQAVDDGLLQYLSPLAGEHINLTGDYLLA